jgi:hypothetical protein
MSLSKLNYVEFYEAASECFLTKYLPYESSEWTDVAIQSHIEEYITEAYELWEWPDIYEAIDDTATVFYKLYRSNV